MRRAIFGLIGAATAAAATAASVGKGFVPIRDFISFRNNSLVKDSSSQCQALPAEEINRDVKPESTYGRRRRKIIIAVDQSMNSFNAVKWAIVNHIRPDDHVILLHVEEPVDKPIGLFVAYSDSTLAVEAMAESDQQMQRLVEERSQNILSTSLDLLKSSEITGQKMVVRDSDARERIISEVDRLHADTLIVASRGMGPVNRLLLGSTSDFCVSHASCPVIIVRPKRQYEQLQSKEGQKL